MKLTIELENLLDEIEALEAAEIGRFVVGAIRYALYMEEPDFRGKEKVIFPKMKKLIDKKKSISNARSEAGKKGMESRWESITNDNKRYQAITTDSKTKHKEKNQKKVYIYNSTTSSNSTSSIELDSNDTTSRDSSMSNTPFVENTQVTKRSTTGRNSTTSSIGGEGCKGEGEGWEVLDAFAEFWNAYPRHKDKQAALKAWKKINPSDELAKQIIAAVETQKSWRQWQDTDYIPYPSTWLNGKRWEDQELPKMTEQQKKLSRLAQMYQEQVALEAEEEARRNA